MNPSSEHPLQLVRILGSPDGKHEGYARIIGLQEEELLVHPGLGPEVHRWSIVDAGSAVFLGSVSLGSGRNTQRILRVGTDRVATWCSPAIVAVWDLNRPDVPLWSRTLPSDDFGSVFELVLDDDRVLVGSADGWVALRLDSGEADPIDRDDHERHVLTAARPATGHVFCLGGGVLIEGVLAVGDGSRPALDVFHRDGRRERIPLPESAGWLSVSAMDDRVSCCSRRGGLWIVDLGSARVEAVSGVDAVEAVFTPNGDRVVFVEQRGSVYSVGSCRVPGSIPAIRLGSIIGCEPFQGSIVVCDDRRLVRCDLATGAWEALPTPPLSEIWMLTRVGGSMVAGGFSGLFTFSGEWHPIVPPDPTCCPRRFVISEDQTTALVGNGGRESRSFMVVERWTRGSKDQPWASCSEPTDEILDDNEVALSADGATEVYVRADRAVVTRSGRTVASFEASSLQDAALCGDTAALVIVDGGRSLRVVDLERPEVERRVSPGARRVRFLGPDLLVVVSAPARPRSDSPRGETLSILRVSDLAPLCEVTLGLSGEVTLLRVVDGRIVVGTSWGTVHVYEVDIERLAAAPAAEGLAIGDAVRVVAGGWTNMTGEVTGVDPDGKLRVTLTLFGRATTVSCEPWQLTRRGPAAD